MAVPSKSDHFTNTDKRTLTLVPRKKRRRSHPPLLCHHNCPILQSAGGWCGDSSVLSHHWHDKGALSEKQKAHWKPKPESLNQ